MLQAWQMAPYIEAVLRQPRSHPLVRATAQLLQARHERTRTRTLERSLMHLQQLAEGADQPRPPVTARLRHTFGVLFPLRPALRKELGEQLLSTGLVGAAMGLFEEEELWDSLIICFRLLQKLPQAQQLVQARLQVCVSSQVNFGIHNVDPASTMTSECLQQTIARGQTL